METCRSASEAKAASKQAWLTAEAAASDAYKAVSGAQETAAGNAADRSQQEVTKSPAAYTFAELSSLASAQIGLWQQNTSNVSDLKASAAISSILQLFLGLLQ